METQDRKELINRLDTLSKGKESAWLKEYQEQRENRLWLKQSQKTALQILRTLRSNHSSQKELAQKMGVSPEKVSQWVKGKTHFSLEIIAKLEVALGCKLA